MMKFTYQTRANRDAKARELRKQGYTVKVRSVRGQVLSPSYVADYDGIPTTNMFGGADTEFFANLYMVEAR
jgi:hypothetical protein